MRIDKAARRPGHALPQLPRPDDDYLPPIAKDLPLDLEQGR